MPCTGGTELPPAPKILQQAALHISISLSISTVNHVLCLAVTLSLNSCENFAMLG